MPFGNKPVGDKTVDFDTIYHNIFAPAISNTILPEGGNLIPKRTDQEMFSGIIDVEMFSYLEYSRFTTADISGLNANVMYELGIRHHGNQSGTAIFRQIDSPLVFDISRIKVFPYEYEPETKASASKALITSVLTDSLVYNRLDSPVQAALSAQHKVGNKLDQVLTDASNAIRNYDINTAIESYKQAIKLDIDNPTLNVELGLLYKMKSKWKEAVKCFEQAVNISSTYSDAYRELGIAQNKLYNNAGDKEDLPLGRKALRTAITYNNQDYDAYASLGGILKREHLYEESLAMYRQATTVSNGHPYPLLNEIKLQVKLEGIGSVTDRQRFLLSRTEVPLQKQVADLPPYDAPWCFFNLSDISFLKEDYANFIKNLSDGLKHANKWQATTHLDSLNLIRNDNFNSIYLNQGIEAIQKIIQYLPD